MKRSGLVSNRLSSVNSPRSRGVPLLSGVRHQWGFASWPQHQPPTLVSSSQNFCLAGNPIVGYGQSIMDDIYRRLCQINALQTSLVKRFHLSYDRVIFTETGMW